MPTPYIKRKSKRVLVVEEMARLYNLHAFFLFNWFEANKVQIAKVKGKPFHIVNASTFCNMLPDIIKVASKVRDDRNTRMQPDRIPTIENMLYRDISKKRVGPFENDDIERPIYASNDTTTNRNGIEVSVLYRVNKYRDGSMTLDVLDYRTMGWQKMERPEKWQCKDIFADWVVMYNLNC